jgi:hypothetical protein
MPQLDTIVYFSTVLTFSFYCGLFWFICWIITKNLFFYQILFNAYSFILYLTYFSYFEFCLFFEILNKFLYLNFFFFYFSFLQNYLLKTCKYIYIL